MLGSLTLVKSLCFRRSLATGGNELTAVLLKGHIIKLPSYYFSSYHRLELVLRKVSYDSGYR